MKWQRDKWGHIIGEDGKEVKFRSVSILCSGTKEREELAEANTNLAAAAPALLEALEGLIDAYAAISLMNEFTPRQNPKYLAAIAAIKTARGEQ
jgi:hypothetical protein